MKSQQVGQNEPRGKYDNCRWLIEGISFVPDSVKDRLTISIVKISIRCKLALLGAAMMHLNGVSAVSCMERGIETRFEAQ